MQWINFDGRCPNVIELPAVVAGGKCDGLNTQEARLLSSDQNASSMIIENVYSPVVGEARTQGSLCGINCNETHLVATLRIVRSVHNLTVQQVFSR